MCNFGRRLVGVLRQLGAEMDVAVDGDHERELLPRQVPGDRRVSRDAAVVAGPPGEVEDAEAVALVGRVRREADPVLAFTLRGGAQQRPPGAEHARRLQQVGHGRDDPAGRPGRRRRVEGRAAEPPVQRLARSPMERDPRPITFDRTAISLEPAGENWNVAYLFVLRVLGADVAKRDQPEPVGAACRSDLAKP
jgi:hypothetical protein